VCQLNFPGICVDKEKDIRKSGSNSSFCKKAPSDFRQLKPLAFLHVHYDTQAEANTFVRLLKKSQVPRR